MRDSDATHPRHLWLTVSCLLEAHDIYWDILPARVSSATVAQSEKEGKERKEEKNHVLSFCVLQIHLSKFSCAASAFFVLLIYFVIAYVIVRSTLLFAHSCTAITCNLRLSD